MHLFVLLLIFLFFLARIAFSVIWTPWMIRRHFEKQGIRGPPYRPINGNTKQVLRMYTEEQSKPMRLCHDIIHRVTPFYHRWSSMYGKTFLYWHGSTPRLATSDPDFHKEVLMNSGGSFDRLDPNPFMKMFYGQGIIMLKGEKWATRRRIANHAFKMEHVKCWIPDIIESTISMLNKWKDEGKEAEEFEIEVSRDLQNLSADVISRVAFGSNFEEGKEIFKLMEQQYHLVSLAHRSAYIPGFRFLPTKKNRERRRLGKETHEAVGVLIQKSIDEQRRSGSLLSLLMTSYTTLDDNNQQVKLDEWDEIIDECKNFYFAGKETTANALIWTLLLLGMHQEWQIKARQEVLSVLGPQNPPNSETLNDLKIVNLILQETNRLYPVAAAFIRQATKNVKIGNIEIPAGTQFFLSMAAMHHDSELWGESAHEFNPMRFTEPRKHSCSYIPFGLGSHFCVGQNLASIEMKLVLPMILQRYSFVVSPTYAHGPMVLMGLSPQYGLQLILRRLSN